MIDCRILPEPVTARLREHGVDLDVRTPGFDLDRGSRVVEARVLKDQSALRSESLGDDGAALRGYASVWGYEYDMYGGPAAFGWTESIERGAATKTIKESNVRFLFDHEGLPLGTTGAGTLRLEDDQFGLYSELTPDRSSPYSMEIVSRVARGEIDSMSFAFRVIRQDWNDDYTRRHIREVQLFDVSAVNYPASPATVIQANSGDGGMESATRGVSLRLAALELEIARLRG